MRRKALRYALLSLIVLTLAFIFGQSALPPATSGAESSAVRDFLGKIFPPSTSLGAFLYQNTRKIAHFAEYALLGTEVSWYACLFMRKNKAFYLKAPLFGLLSAFADETVQIFSKRAPSIIDVWIDLFGYLSGFALVGVTFFIISKLKQGKNNGKN